MSDNRRADAENAIVQAIATWNQEHEFGCAFRDVALLTNLSLGRVHELCRDLRDAGRITFADHVARSLKLPTEV